MRRHTKITSTTINTAPTSLMIKALTSLLRKFISVLVLSGLTTAVVLFMVYSGELNCLYYSRLSFISQ